MAVAVNADVVTQLALVFTLYNLTLVAIVQFEAWRWSLALQLLLGLIELAAGLSMLGCAFYITPAKPAPHVRLPDGIVSDNIRVAEYAPASYMYTQCTARLVSSLFFALLAAGIATANFLYAWHVSLFISLVYYAGYMILRSASSWYKRDLLAVESAIQAQ